MISRAHALRSACPGLRRRSSRLVRALAWGATGHRLIGQLGATVATLPPELPAFLRSPEAIGDIGELVPRARPLEIGGGGFLDTSRDPAHFLDVDDNGKILGGPSLDALPPTRGDYEGGASGRPHRQLPCRLSAL